MNQKKKPNQAAQTHQALKNNSSSPTLIELEAFYSRFNWRKLRNKIA
jgi:hypothetical protein